MTFLELAFKTTISISFILVQRHGCGHTFKFLKLIKITGREWPMSLLADIAMGMCVFFSHGHPTAQVPDLGDPPWLLSNQKHTFFLLLEFPLPIPQRSVPGREMAEAQTYSATQSLGKPLQSPLFLCDHPVSIIFSFSGSVSPILNRCIIQGLECQAQWSLITCANKVGAIKSHSP